MLYYSKWQHKFFSVLEIITEYYFSFLVWKKCYLIRASFRSYVVSSNLRFFSSLVVGRIRNSNLKNMFYHISKLLFLFFIKSNTKIISFFHFYLNPIPFLLFFIVQILFWFLQSRRFDVPLEFFMPKAQDRERNKITEKNRLRLTKTTEISQTE